MNRGPVAGRSSGTDYVAKVQDAWGEVPDFVMELALEASKTTQSAIAKRIGYSAPVVSDVFANKYRGDMVRLEQKVRGVLMGATVICPILGEIGRDRCLDEQRVPFSASSSIRSKLYRACRNGCPNARLHTQE